MPSDAKRALIVGGSCAIGQSIALLLAQDGFQVIVTYHSSQQSVLALAEQNALISSKQLDLTAPKDVLEAFAAQVVAEGGGKSPEVTVFCAAAIKPVVFGEIDADAFDMHYHSIVRGPLWLIQVRCRDLQGQCPMLTHTAGPRSHAAARFAHSPLLVCPRPHQHRV